MPRWSPDDTGIAFAGVTPGKPPSLYQISASGGPVEKLLPNNTQGEVYFDWSPDGRQIALSRNPDSLEVDIELFDLATRRFTRLPGSQGVYYPRWSPEGRYLIGMSYPEGKLMLFDLTRRQWKLLVPDRVWSTTWSRDGKYVYFFSVDKAKGLGVSRIRISDLKTESVAPIAKRSDLSTLEFGGVIEWDWFGFAPDGSLLTARDYGPREIYALDWETP